MRYSNNPIRRQDRLLDINLAVNILKNGEYGVLSMQDDNGGGYGIPISHV